MDGYGSATTAAACDFANFRRGSGGVSVEREMRVHLQNVERYRMVEQLFLRERER